MLKLNAEEASHSGFWASRQHAETGLGTAAGHRVKRAKKCSLPFASLEEKKKKINEARMPQTATADLEHSARMVGYCSIAIANAVIRAKWAVQTSSDDLCSEFLRT
jgi:hypothetical protein